MSRLLEALSINGGAETEGNALAEVLVVGESSNTLVVDLGLFVHVSALS